MRSDCDVVIEIDAASAMADGVKFYKSSNDVILTSGLNGVLSTRYFREVTDWRKKTTIEIPGKKVTAKKAEPVPCPGIYLYSDDDKRGKRQSTNMNKRPRDSPTDKTPDNYISPEKTHAPYSHKNVDYSNSSKKQARWGKKKDDDDDYHRKDSYQPKGSGGW